MLNRASKTWLKKVYRGGLHFVAAWPRAIMLAVAVACLATLLVLPHFGSEFLPDFREGHFVVQAQMTPGASLPEMLRMGKLISLALLDNKHIDTVEEQIGRAEQGEDSWGPQRCEFHVELKPLSGEEEEGVGGEIRKILEQFPGIQFEVVTFLGDRISESISGETAPVVVNVFGDDLDAIDAKAAEIAQVLGTVPGAKDVQVKSPPGLPRMTVRLRPDRLAQFGFRPVDVMEAVQTAYEGTVVAQVHQGSQVSDVAVVLEETGRRDPESVGALMLSNAQGLRMPLNQRWRTSF